MRARKKAGAQRTMLQGGHALSVQALGEEPESSLQARIQIALAASGVLVWRNNVGLADYKHTKVVYGLGKGSADLIGLVKMPNGVARFFGCEVKRRLGKVRPNQERWMEIVRRWGGYVVVARSVEDALKGVEEAKAGVLQ